MKNITKFFLFVILGLAVLLAILVWVRHAQDNEGRIPPSEFSGMYEAARVTGTIEYDAVRESSGLAASGCQPGVLWTHNDSGDEALIYAMSPAGKHLGTWRVAGAEHIDWEDMALVRDRDGRCSIYIGEIGNNDLERAEGKIYRVPEPVIAAEAAGSTRDTALMTERAESMTFTYPDGRHDAEALLVHPETGTIYVVTKKISEPAGVYRIEPRFGTGQRVAAEKAAEIAVPAVPQGLVTGGDISADGRKVVLCDYSAAYELALPGDATQFDEIWKQKPAAFDIGNRRNGESIAISPDGLAVFATGEKRNSEIFGAKRRPN